MDLSINTQSHSEYLHYQGNKDFGGFIKIWQHNSETGASKLIVDQKNTILYGGADLLAYALAGQAHARISHFYVGYNNNAGFTGPGSPVDKTNSTFLVDADYGYLKIPLTFPASYLEEANYQHNIVVFTILLANPNPFRQGASPTFSSSSKLFEVGLVAALNPDGNNNDVVFSRAQFTPLQYDPGFNLTISWGIKFTA